MPSVGMLVAYTLVMAGVTYFIRMLPFVVFRKPIRSRFIRSFLYYVPYAVLGAMTLPAIFYSTGVLWSALVGLAVAIVLSWRGKGLLTVAICACVAAYITELLLGLLNII